jgi:Mor family transcriptional regulator
MTTKSDDDLVVRLADVAVAAVCRALLDFAPAISREITTAVRKEFSGEQVYIPKDLGEQKAQRNEAMHIDRAAGLSVRAIARKHYISKTHAAKILKGNR